MTHNQLITCGICNTEINIRAQIGYFNIPFNLYCPNCSTHISGKLVIDQEKTDLQLELENAHKTSNADHDLDAKYYIAELSAEFPTRKIHNRTLKEYDLSPFMRNFMFYKDNQKAMEATRSAVAFADFIKTDWSKTKSYFALFWNEQGSILYPKLQDKVKKYKQIPLSKITNDLDAAVALHQLLLTTTGISYVLHPNALSEYSEIAKSIFCDMSKLGEIITFINEQGFDPNDIEKKAFELIDVFAKIYNQLIPVVALKNADCMDNVDREQFGIMTANFNELTDFYAKSYEWILDNINIVICLNNILTRGQYSRCIDGKDYKDVLSARSKLKKLEFINASEPFSKSTISLSNRIRNAIQHFDREIDYVSQKIVFSDKHAGKTKKEELYLIDFAALCLENFSMIIYLLELVYNLRKVSLISQGIAPSFINDTSR